ncbi:MAG: Trp biosynthesis-associated membrane protein [Microlunatus sp.]
MSRAVTLAVLLAGAGLGFVAGAQPWWRASGDGAAVTFSGSDATGGLCQALAAVTSAGILLLLVLRRRGRRILAILIAGTGIGMIATGALRSAPDADAVRARVRQVSLTDQFALDTTAWPWVYAAAGLVVLVGAVLLWLGASRWSTGVSRFDRAAQTATPSPRPTVLADDPAQAWKDLDAGRDPTADPDVRPGDESVTMENTDQSKRE